MMTCMGMFVVIAGLVITAMATALPGAVAAAVIGLGLISAGHLAEIYRGGLFRTFSLAIRVDGDAAALAMTPRDHQWGPSPFHYIDEAYKFLAQGIRKEPLACLFVQDVRPAQ